MIPKGHRTSRLQPTVGRDCSEWDFAVLFMSIGMKLPKWNGLTRPSVYVLALACFVVGFAVVTVLSLGQIKYDDREGPGWNPITRMPDGKVGLSEFAVTGIGFAALSVGLAALLGLGIF